jgi:polysaccharide biosynthesis transport protein
MDENEKTLADVIAIIKRRKWYLLWPAVSIFFLTVIIALFWPPTYQSTSTILIEEQSIPRDYVRTTVSDYAEMRLQIINQRIMSSMRLSEIINRFNLYADLRKKETIEAAIEKMREKDIKFETNSANVIDGRTGQSKMATISFSLSYKGRDPGVVQQVANVLASLYLEENLRVREQQTEGATKFMDDERKIIEEQLAEIDGKIAVFKKDNVNTLPELSQYNLQIIDRLAEETDRLNVKIKELKEKENYLQSQLINISPNISNPDKDRLKELRVKLLNLESRFTDEYPDVQKTKAEIADLEKKIKKPGRMSAGSDPDNPAYVTLSAQLASTRSEIASVNGQIKATRGKYSDYQRRIVTTPQVEENYKVLMMQRGNLQAKYDDLTKKYMESKVASGLEKGQMGERFTLIEAAKLSQKPVSPNVPAIIMIGLILGIGAGMAAAALKEFSDQSAYTAEKLSSVLALPVLAVIPEISIAKEEPRKENRQRKHIMTIGIAAAVVCVIVLLFHFFIMDLDILWAKITRTIGSLFPS